MGAGGVAPAAERGLFLPSWITLADAGRGEAPPGCAASGAAEIRASALQFVRKLSGATRPSKANEEVFNQAVEDVTEAAQRLIRSLTTNAPPRNREIEAEKAKERARQRYA